MLISRFNNHSPSLVFQSSLSFYTIYSTDAAYNFPRASCPPNARRASLSLTPVTCQNVCLNVCLEPMYEGLIMGQICLKYSQFSFEYYSSTDACPLRAWNAHKNVPYW